MIERILIIPQEDSEKALLEWFLFRFSSSPNNAEKAILRTK